MPPIVNLGILAHVDAGKTSLTERLLHLAGVVDEPGRVDDGSTHTDSLALDHHRPVRGPAPTRPRPSIDPWRRKEYLLQVDRRVGAR